MKTRIFVAVAAIFTVISVCHAQPPGAFEKRVKTLVDSALGGMFQYESCAIDETGLIRIKVTAAADPAKKMVFWAPSSADLLIIGSVYNRSGQDLTIERYSQDIGKMPYKPEPPNSGNIEDMKRNIAILNATVQPATTPEEKLQRLHHVRSMFEDPKDFDDIYTQLRASVDKEALTSDRVVHRKIEDEKFMSKLTGSSLGAVDQYKNSDPVNTLYIFFSLNCQFSNQAHKQLTSDLDKLKASNVAVKWVPVVLDKSEVALKKAALALEKGFEPDLKTQHTVSEASIQKVVENTDFFTIAFELPNVPIVVWLSENGIESISGYPSRAFDDVFIDIVANRGSVADLLFAATKRIISTGPNAIKPEKQ